MSDADQELADVREQMRTSELFADAATAQLDALRASVHEQLRARGIDASSDECEQTMLVAGGVIGQLLASSETTALLSNIAADDQRGAVASLLYWLATISPHPAQQMPT